MPRKTIAIDLDDTLNDFTQTLRRTKFEHDGSHAFSKAVFNGYIERLRSGARDEGDLLSTEYSFFKYKIHQRCYELAGARADGVEFMRWLRVKGWQIVICTHRDLRRANACTRQWLNENGIPFDYLFMAWNKIVFCRTWGIRELVDDSAFNIAHGEAHGVNVYYPLSAGPAAPDTSGARGFTTFDELKPWIES
jgi:hypothetical protein